SLFLGCCPAARGVDRWTAVLVGSRLSQVRHSACRGPGFDRGRRRHGAAVSRQKAVARSAGCLRGTGNRPLRPASPETSYGGGGGKGAPRQGSIVGVRSKTLVQQFRARKSRRPGRTVPSSRNRYFGCRRWNNRAAAVNRERAANPQSNP